ncbi:hypothetical protein [Streptomyces sp. A5-4]|uniref:hypothetical protein n=1 Tax=Streptomyces sp. A5-4 TaxID=3384771 RepID=UPI003DA8BB4D
MKAEDWEEAVSALLLWCIFTPAMLYMVIKILCRHAVLAESWRSPKIIPFLPFSIRLNATRPKREARKVAALSRYCGRVTESRISQLESAYSASELAERWFLRNIILMFTAFTSGVVVLFLGFRGLDPELAKSYKVTPETTPYLAAGFSANIMLAVAAINYRRWEKILSDRASDLKAIRSCFAALTACEALIRGHGSILAVEKRVGEISHNIARFPVANVSLSTDARLPTVLAHISAVQKELKRSSGEVLRGGVAQSLGLVVTLSTLLDRLIAERWLNLLDIDDSAETVAGLDTQDDIRRDRRDTWIVMSGSLVAAIVLGSVIAVGMPLAVGAPAALVFLLGPAVLWGSRRLGASPKGLLEAVETSLSESPQANPPMAPQQPAVSSNGNLVP